MMSLTVRSKKLRTKKGCVSCRDRRKKCDERKPSCATCERLGIKCQWPNLALLEDRRERGAANSRWAAHTPKSPDTNSETSGSGSETSVSRAKTYTVRALPKVTPKEEVRFSYPASWFGVLSYNTLLLRSDREHALLSYYCESFLPANVLRTSHPKFSRVFLGDNDEIKYSVFACSAIKYANGKNGPPIEALNYYTRAVTGLRKRLNSGELTGLEDWLLLVTVLLHCFETWRCDANHSAPAQFQHLLGAIQLLKLRYNNPAEEVHHDFYVLMAESILFHVSTILASSSAYAILKIDSSLWQWVEGILRMPAYDDALLLANHPVLGTPWELNKLIFEISKLSTMVPLTESDVLHKDRLAAEVTEWEENEARYTRESQPSPEKDPYLKVRQLYIICARILLLWVESTGKDTQAPAFEEQIRAQKLKAMEILYTMGDSCDESWNYLMRWPLLILGYTVETKLEQDVTRHLLTRIWETSDCGDVKRSLDKMDLLWKEKSLSRRAPGPFGFVARDLSLLELPK